MWKVDHDGAGRAIVCTLETSPYRLICRPNATTEMSASSVATLIAAAPDLLRELKHLLAEWEESIAYEPDYMHLGDAARAVIAKAEGRTA